MELNELQQRVLKFERERGWDKFRESLIYAHLIEEVTEIGRFILAKEGYKVENLGHASASSVDVGSEFAQALTLFIQLANRFGVDLSKAVEQEITKMEKRFPAGEWRRYMEEKRD